MAQQGQDGIAGGRHTRPDQQRPPGAVASHQTAGPARAGKHDGAHRQKRRPGLGGGIAVDLNQAERQKEQAAAQRGVQQQGEQIHPSKRP